MGSLAPQLASVATIPQPVSAWFETHSPRTERTALNGDDPAEAIRQAGQNVSIGRDESLFCEGDPADAVFVVVSGTVRLSKMLADGRRQIIGFREAGDLIGFALSHDHSYSAEGVTSARLRRVNRIQLERLVEAKPQLRLSFFSLAASELAAAQRQLLLLGRKTARERLCSFLVERRHDGSGIIKLPMSRTDIADYLGLTIETVSRTLSQLRAEGLIRMPTLHSLELANADRLGDLAEAA
jgi:CRP/FNR family transcriptional regulator